MEPASAAADDVRGVFADAAQVWRGAERQLLGGERRERSFPVRGRDLDRALAAERNN